MPPSVHTCIECHARLPLTDSEIECPDCERKYLVEPAERGARVYPLGSDRSLTELRLGTLHEWAKKQRGVEC